MNFIRDIKLKENGNYNVIIEITKGSKDKNELVEPNFDRVEKVRKCKLKYPFYYGCFPQTLAGDNDPADAIILTSRKHKVLDVVKVQPIALIKTIDKGEEDHKFICVEGCVKNIDKVEKKILKFLATYKGKDADTVIDSNIYTIFTAIAELDEAHKCYIDKNRKEANKTVSKGLKVE